MIGRAAQGSLVTGAIAAALKAGTTCHTIPSTVGSALQRRHSESLHEFHGEYLDTALRESICVVLIRSLRNTS